MTNKAIIEQLQEKILSLQGIKRAGTDVPGLDLGLIEGAFPGNVFPRACIHELISTSSEEASCTNGFVSVILSKLMHKGGKCVWISTNRKVFPPALISFGIEPERIVFIDTWRTKDALWTIEEALKCEALSAVIGEVSELSFNDSRRLQLAVEKSKVTGFIHRHQPKQMNAVACVSRWKIKPVASMLNDDMPGLGFPRWEIELLKVRNGRPAKWLVQWGAQGLEYISEKITTKMDERRTA